MKPRFFHPIRLLLLALVLGTGGMTACNLVTKPVVVIASPPSGSTFREGEDVAVQSASVDTVGVVRVELSVDGAVVRSDTPPGAQSSFSVIQKWKATPGAHIITVRAFNTAGVPSDPVAISIAVTPASAALPVAPVAPAPPPAVAPAPPAPPPPAGCPSAPIIDFFNASPSTINAGQSTTLLWGKVDYATKAEIDQGIGGVATPGTRTVSPATTTTYTMSATGCGGTTSKQATVTVSGSAAPPPSGAEVAPAPPPGGYKPASGSCLPGFAWREASSSDKVCVTPAARAQAQADNAAAASRREVATHGPDSCKTGFVWREAYSGDVVCVTTAVRSQAAADNDVTVQMSRTSLPIYPRCFDGFVWREANSTDRVCVTPATRDQTAADNAAAASRKLLQFGPDTCKAGFVWREAFSGDRVCVTPDVHTQTKTDNGLAPSRTYP